MARYKRPSSLVAAAGVVLAIGLGAAAVGDAGRSAAPAGSGSTVVGLVDAQRVEQAAAEFSASGSVAASHALLDAIERDPQPRWVPWLVDLLRADVSTSVSRRTGVTLEALTGVESTTRVPDMIAFGSWAQTLAVDPGPGYREFKSQLYERFDRRFGPLLRSVVDPLDLAAIQWGGVPLGGIPELNDPERVPAADADWMIEDEVVLGVVNNGEAVAYPLRILARHELANDIVGGEPLAIVYCTLCRSALLFERTFDGQTLDFLTSGLLLNSNKIMYDTQTATLWQHLRGFGIGGPLAGRELVLRSVNHMRWSDWIAEYPDSEVLSLPSPIFFDEPERPPIAYDYTPGAAYSAYYGDPDVWFPIIDAPDTFEPKAEVVGIEHNGDALALELDALTGLPGPQEFEVGGATFVVESTGVGARVYDAAGQPVMVEQSFWFAWYTNHQDTRTWPAG